VAYYSDDRKKMSVLLKGSVSLPLVCWRNTRALWQ
jgi:hypothetical protein